jgi:hypothetical protein
MSCLRLSLMLHVLVSAHWKMRLLTALPVLLMVPACLLSVGPLRVAASYNIGVGIADVTGPSAEVGFVSTPLCLATFSILKPT